MYDMHQSLCQARVEWLRGYSDSRGSRMYHLLYTMFQNVGNFCLWRRGRAPCICTLPENVRVFSNGEA